MRGSIRPRAIAPLLSVAIAFGGVAGVSHPAAATNAPGIVAVAPLGTVGAVMAMSHDGRYVAFDTIDTRLVATPGTREVFRYDRVTGATAAVSITATGAQAPGTNSAPSISADGRYVAYLVGAPGRTVVYRRDMASRRLDLVSTGSTALEDPDLHPLHFGYAASISGNGRYVAFVSWDDTGQFRSVYVRDVVAATTQSWPAGDDYNVYHTAFDNDGRYLAWTSGGVALSDLRGSGRIVLSPYDEYAPDAAAVAISADGRYVAYSYSVNPTGSQNVPRTAVYDRVTRTRRFLPITIFSAFSSDGRFIATGSSLFDLRTGAVQHVPDLCAGGGSIDAVNGGWIAYAATAPTSGDSSPWLYVVPVPGAASQPYRLAAADGGVFTYGGARFYGSAGNLALRSPIVAMAARSGNDGYWLAAADGGVFSFGAAHFAGSLGAIHLAQPIVGMAAAPDGKGYWLVARDGGVFAFGSARFFGSLGTIRLAQPIVGMAAAPDGKGYWLVARDGGVFAFGSARFRGALSGTHAPAVGITPTLRGDGYWIAMADGGVANFGAAPFLGSLPGLHVGVTSPVVTLAGARDTCGFRLAASDGGVFPFGGTGFSGSAGALALTAPIVAIG